MNNPRVLSIVTALAAGLASASFACAADAESVAIVTFTGEQHRVVEARVAKALNGADVSVAKGKPIADPGDDAPAFVKLGKRRHVDKFVVGHVEGSGHRWSVSLTVRNASDGALAGDSIVTKAKSFDGLLRALDRKVPDELVGALAGGVKLDEGTPAKDDSDAKEHADASEPDAVGDVAADNAAIATDSDSAATAPADNGAKRSSSPRERVDSPLALSAGLRVFSRDFSYNGAGNGLRGYGLGGAPALWLGGEWYPGAHFTAGVAANIGLVASFAQSFGVSSGRDDGGSENYGTSMQTYDVGVRGRIPLGVHEIGVSFRYGGQSFHIDGALDPSTVAAAGAAPTRSFVPDVSYGYIRPGIDARLRFGDFGVGASLGYRKVLSFGDLASSAWFPSASANAVDLGVSVEYRLLGSLYAVAGGGLEHYSVTMNGSAANAANAGTAPIATSASDQYLSAHFGAEWFL
jgi:hypothetical protein